MFKVSKWPYRIPDMMRLFAGGATTPLVVKMWTKQHWVKIENSRNFDLNFALSRDKIWLWLFLIFCVMVPKFYTKKIQVILSKNEGMTAIFQNFDFILNRENQCHGFIFTWNDLRFFLCRILEP